MGHGGYSSEGRAVRARSLGYTTRPAREIFSNRLNSAMSPNRVTLRESRDSAEHPRSFPIILGLDVTGSMGRVPHFLVREGLPHVVQSIISGGVADPQVLFMGIGDHEYDTAPLQIGQFESSDELMDQWLTNLWIERGGGGNAGESYLLAWYFASRHTAHDHWDRRGQKGVLFTIGDEPCLPTLPVRAQKAIMGPGQYENVSAASLLEAAREKYEVFHLNVMHDGRRRANSSWEQLIGDGLIQVQNQEHIASTIVEKTIEVAATQGTTAVTVSDTRFEHLSE